MWPASYSATLDKLGHFAMSCMKSFGATRRHKTVVETIRAKVFRPTRMEAGPEVPNLIQGSDGRRDLCLGRPDGKVDLPIRTTYDVTIRWQITTTYQPAQA